MRLTHKSYQAGARTAKDILERIADEFDVVDLQTAGKIFSVTVTPELLELLVQAYNSLGEHVADPRYKELRKQCTRLQGQVRSLQETLRAILVIPGVRGRLGSQPIPTEFDLEAGQALLVSMEPQSPLWQRVNEEEDW